MIVGHIPQGAVDILDECEEHGIVLAVYRDRIEVLSHAGIDNEYLNSFLERLAEHAAGVIEAVSMWHAADDGRLQ